MLRFDRSKLGSVRGCVSCGLFAAAFCRVDAVAVWISFEAEAPANVLVDGHASLTVVKNGFLKLRKSPVR
ncbi:MAG: hypothetical protein RDV00_07660 [Clostridia bacterium]|nr:hypothetical protein [Clostridia bacterium]MDQ7791976.1 hypothetical protein [Clostridia bacterium]